VPLTVGEKMNKILVVSLAILSSFQVYALDLVQTIQIEDGRSILANQEGMTLYTFDQDDPGVSNCHGGCLSVWPAVIVESGIEVESPYSLTQRDDGQMQLMLNDEPLYLFVGDKKQGDIRGDNLQNVWHIIEMSAEGRNISEHNLTSTGVGMLNGRGNSVTAFDPVSFFAEGGGVGLEGLKEFSVIHEGVEYLFATAANMKLFQAEPAKYEPTYGGWCARAMVVGQKVHINTKYFTVQGKRSFFFVNKRAKRFFDRNLEENISKADSEWKKISGEMARM
jgi:predicted lipoprotein with Yx(FWY)xxD motif